MKDDLECLEENIANNIYRIIIVAGPQRSGTRIASHIIAEITGYDYIDEHDYGVHKIEAWQKLVANENRVVIHAPGMSRELLTIKHYDDVLIVFMSRQVSDIVASEKRINWRWKKERGKYDKTNNGIPVSTLKYQYWIKTQRDNLPHTYDLDYLSLSTHPLWLDNDKRKGFKATQWKLAN
jgi:glycosylphosphatidylinositol transamidase (GPIT) subunit GPI8